MVGTERSSPGLEWIKLGSLSVPLWPQVPSVSAVLAGARLGPGSLAPEPISARRQPAVLRGFARACPQAGTLLPITSPFPVTVMARAPRIGVGRRTVASPMVVVHRPPRIASRLRSTRPTIASRLRATGAAIASRPSRIDVRGEAVTIAAATASLVPRVRTGREAIAEIPVAVSEAPRIGCSRAAVSLAETVRALTAGTAGALPVGCRAVAGLVIHRAGPPLPIPAVGVWLPLPVWRELAGACVRAGCRSATGLARCRV